MKHLKKQSGYSLIELLVAVSLTVFVATLATATLSSTTRLQAVNTQGHLVAAQIQQAQQEIARDVQAAAAYAAPTNTTPFQIVELTGTSGSNYPRDNLLTMIVPGRNADGTSSSDVTLARRIVYCAEFAAANPLKKRLVRFSMPANSVYNSTTIATPVCSWNNVQNMFRPNPVAQTEYLGDTGIEVLNLRFWHMYYEGSTRQAAVRMELSVHPASGPRAAANQSEIHSYVSRVTIDASGQLKQN